ncbi:MAG TPA: hypothetical protein VGP64_03860 [Polyangia bacterium]|jgi:hypothetical protein
MGARIRAGVCLTALLVVAGCATSEGDTAMKRGAYEEAASSYDAELRAMPGDQTLEQKRAAARAGALRAKLERARDLRTSGHGEAALSLLNEALRLETKWSLAPEGDVRALRDAELAGARETVEAAVRADLGAGAPLAAEGGVKALAPLLAQPALRPIGEAVAAEIATAGKARCAELAAQQKGETPHLARLVAAYCTHVGGSFTAPVPPEQTRGLRVSGRLENATEAEHQIVESWLADVFRASPWFAPDGENLSTLELGGAYNARLERRRVVLNAPYRTVTRSTVTEGMLGLGPTATVQTESERVFEYEAEQYDARYGLDATLTLDLGTGPPLVVTIHHVENKRAYQHETTFAPANVYPQRAKLPDINTWLSTFLGTKRTPMLRKLRARWVSFYCGGKRFSPEEAARCLAAGQRLPAAEKALAAVFGGDAQAVVETLTRPRADERKPGEDEKMSGAKPTAPTPKPDIEEVPRSGAGESI